MECPAVNVVDEESIRAFIASTFEGVDVTIGSEAAGSPELAWGDTFFIYDPNHDLPPNLQFPFATIVIKDYGDFDNASDLNRPGVFRLNIGVSRQTFDSLFSHGAEHDFTTLDTLMPHPVYGRNHWVCVLNPSAETFASLQPLLAEAYGIAARRRRRGGAEDPATG